MAVISREQIIEQSVETYLRNALFTERGYSEGDIALIDEYPWGRQGGLEKSCEIAFGYDFDAPEEEAECGSDLVRKQYTIEFWVMGETRIWAKNIAHIIKFALAADQTIALHDVEDDSVLGFLDVVNTTSQRQSVPDPEPWQRFTWLTVLRVIDTYSLSTV